MTTLNPTLTAPGTSLGHRIRYMPLTTRLKLGFFIGGLVLAFFLPSLLSSYLVNMLSLAMIFTVYAMSVNLLLGFGGLTSMGMGGQLAVGAYAVGYISVLRGGSFGQQLATAFVAGLVISAIFGAMVMRVTAVYFLIVTLAQGMIIWGLANRLSLFGSDNGLRGITRPEFLRPYTTFYYFVLAVVLVVAGIVWVIVNSPFGLSLRGLRNSPTRLEMLGYSTVLTRFYVFMLASMIGILSGVLFALFNQFVSPFQAAFLNSGKGVLMAIMGGIGTFSGPLVGALLITLAENVLSIYITRWPTLLGITFILVILFAQKGVVGSISAAFRRRFPSASEVRGSSSDEDAPASTIASA
jgi:branched-chain amino acid transport system permease protein